MQKENEEKLISLSTIGKIILSLHAGLSDSYQVLELPLKT